jgi:broad specificity phosphatase PhoE
VAEAVPPRVYLVRHGETDWNAVGRLMGRTDNPINATGERQAAALAESLRGMCWDRAIASPSQRARRTAEIVLSTAASRPALEFDERLLEVDFGPWEGWTEAELAADPVASARRRDGAAIPGVEPDADVEARARAFMAELGASAGRTLVVGHGRMLRILIATVVLGVPASASGAMRIRNCLPAVIEPGPRPLLLALNLGAPADAERAG